MLPPVRQRTQMGDILSWGGGNERQQQCIVGRENSPEEDRNNRVTPAGVGYKRNYGVGGVMGGLATKIASEKYLGLSFNNEKHAKNLTTALGKI